MDRKVKTVMDCLAQVAEHLTEEEYKELLERLQYEIDKKIECDL